MRSPHFNVRSTTAAEAAGGTHPLDRPHPLRPPASHARQLRGLTTVAQILSTPDDDRWKFALPGGQGLHTVVEFMYPYIQDKSKWPHPPDVMFWEDWPVRCPSLLFASQAYSEPKYFDLWKTLDAGPTNEEILRNLPLRQPVLWAN